MTRRQLAALALIGALFAFAVLTSGCAGADKDYWRELPPGEHALRKLDAKDVPDFTRALADPVRLSETCANSLDYLAKPSARQFFPVSGISHEQVTASLNEFRAILQSGKSPAEMNDEVRRRFDVYTTVGFDDHGSVLFTGYYTPIFQASPTKTDRFKFPLYKLPP